MNFLFSYLQGIKDGIGIVANFHKRSHSDSKPSTPLDAFEDLTINIIQKDNLSVPEFIENQTEVFEAPNETQILEPVSEVLVIDNQTDIEQPANEEDQKEVEVEPVINIQVIEKVTFNLIQIKSRTKNQYVSTPNTFIKKLIKNTPSDVPRIDDLWQNDESPATFLFKSSSMHNVSKIVIDYPPLECAPSSFGFYSKEQFFGSSTNGSIEFETPVFSDAFEVVAQTDADSSGLVCISGASFYAVVNE